MLCINIYVQCNVNKRDILGGRHGSAGQTPTSPLKILNKPLVFTHHNDVTCFSVSLDQIIHGSMLFVVVRVLCACFMVVHFQDSYLCVPAVYYGAPRGNRTGKNRWLGEKKHGFLWDYAKLRRTFTRSWKVGMDFWRCRNTFPLPLIKVLCPFKVQKTELLGTNKYKPKWHRHAL